jgi:hypothetical protein
MATATESRVKPRPIFRANTATQPTTARSTSALSATSKAKAKSSKMKSETSFSSLSTDRIREIAVLVTTDGLPVFAKAKWSTSFLPTLYACLGAASNPWKLYKHGSNMVDTIQEILDIVYPNSGYRVLLGDKIFSMVRLGLITRRSKETNILLG